MRTLFGQVRRRDIPEARRTAPAKMALSVVLRPNMMRDIYRWTGGCGWAKEGWRRWDERIEWKAREDKYKTEHEKRKVVGGDNEGCESNEREWARRLAP